MTTPPDTSAAEVVAKPAAYVVKLNYGSGRWSGDMLTDFLPSDDSQYQLVDRLYSGAQFDTSRAETAAANARADALERERAYAMETVDRQGKEIGRLLAVLQREGSELIQWQGRSEAAEAELRDIREALPAEYRMWDSLGNAIRAITEIEGKSK